MLSSLFRPVRHRYFNSRRRGRVSKLLMKKSCEWHEERKSFKGRLLSRLDVLTKHGRELCRLANWGAGDVSRDFVETPQNVDSRSSLTLSTTIISPPYTLTSYKLPHLRSSETRPSTIRYFRTSPGHHSLGTYLDHPGALQLALLGDLHHGQFGPRARGIFLGGDGTTGSFGRHCA